MQKQLFWEERQRVLATTNRARPLTTSVERALLRILGSVDQSCAQHLLSLSWLRESRQRAGNETARFALRSAQAYGVDSDTVLIEECSQLKRSGQHYRALTLLEPAELNADIIEQQLNNRKTCIC